MSNEKTILIECFNCLNNIYKGDQIITKTIERSFSDSIFTNSWNNSTTYENITICKNCSIKEMEIPLEFSHSWKNALYPGFFILEFLIFFEIYKDFDNSLKLKYFFLSIALFAFTFLLIGYYDFKKNKVKSFILKN
ncbi:MAG: hypothetical protein AM1032_000135 [Mycoplasmataceae bacterium]|nr:MAG: hypothetical protein AM1032_000135 [Mycoplasmataceae bacterium]